MVEDEEVEKAAALERKQKRLEAWRKRQEEKAKAAESEKPKAKITLSLGAKKLPNRKRKKTGKRNFGFGGDNEDDDDAKEEKKSLDLFDVADMKAAPATVSVPSITDDRDTSSSPAKKKRRWGATAETSNVVTDGNNNNQDDDLDKFMDDLKAGAMGKVVLQKTKQGVLSVDVSGSMLRPPSKPASNIHNAAFSTSGGVITSEELAKLTGTKDTSSRTEDGAYYGPSDWETSASEASFSN
jgi:hypothetical protein